MGWGVGQSETLAAGLAELTGETVLNAAEPSYGTAREMLLLRRVDLSAASTLVIQYRANDLTENAAFLQNGAQLPTMAERTYRALVRDHLSATRYWPGKHLKHMLALLWRTARGGDGPREPRDCAREARVFLDVLEHAGPPRPLRVVAWEATYTPEQPACFGGELAALAARRALPAWISELRVIDPAPLLVESDYYPLDEHLKASAYRKIAAAIAGVLAERTR